MNFKKHLGYYLMMVMAFVGVTMSSCSNSNETTKDKLENYVSDNTDMVYKIDLERTLSALDASANDDGQLTLSRDVSSILRSSLNKSERKTFDRFLEFKGFDWNNVVVGLKFKELERDDVRIEMLLVFSVTDEDEFGESITKASDGHFVVEEKNGYTTIGDANGTIMVDGKTGYVAITEKGVCMPTQAAEIIENWHKEAKDNPLAEWKTNYLTEAKIGSALISMRPIIKAMMFEGQTRQNLKFLPSDVKNGYIAGTFDVSGPSMSATLSMFNEKGGKIKIPGFKSCDPSLTKYASSSDQLIACAGVGNLSQFRNQILQAEPGRDVEEFCNYILPLFDNASVMFSAGAKDVKAFNSSSPADVHMVFAAGFKDVSSARTVYDMIANQIGQSGSDEFVVQVPAGSQFNEYTYDYETTYMTVYGRIEGANVIVSNAPLQQSSRKAVASDFAGKNLAVVLNVAKNDPILSGLNLPVGAKASLSLSGTEASAQITLTGTNKKLINALLDVLMGIGLSN